MSPRYKIVLNEQDRKELERISKNKRSTAGEFIRARALLLCDTGPGAPGWKASDAAKALGITTRTVEHLKRHFIQHGFEFAVHGKTRQKFGRRIRFNQDFEAKLMSLACSEPPEGHRRWTVRLLAEKAVELGMTQSISHMSVQRILKKMNSSHSADPEILSKSDA